jgi:hypothetical protein
VNEIPAYGIVLNDEGECHSLDKGYSSTLQRNVSFSDTYSLRRRPLHTNNYVPWGAEFCPDKPGLYIYPICFCCQKGGILGII